MDAVPETRGPFIPLPSGAREGTPAHEEAADSLVLGRRIRYFRTRRGMTLRQLADAVGSTASQLSLIENGRREPRLSLLHRLADQLGVTVPALLSADAPPSRRAQLEIELERAQQSPLFATLGVPPVRPGRTLPMDALESLVALHRELLRRAEESVATPEEARRANNELRLIMRQRDNYIPEIEDLAEELVRRAGYTVGALTHSTVNRLAAQLGFEIVHTPDLPHSTRTVTDLANGRVYLPPASIPGGHGLRSLALQALGHRVLGHDRPASYADFLRQRVEVAYFASCCLIPRSAAVEYLRTAKANRDLAIEEFRDSFGVTHEAAAMRFTNLATSHLDIRVHMLRVEETGAISKGYENDDVTLPRDAVGAFQGETVCRRFAARAAFDRTTRTNEFHQYTDTPAGTFWCSTQTGRGTGGEFSITVGVPFDDAQWFRGRETSRRATSTCPEESCCRRPDPELTRTWRDAAWPDAVVHNQIFAPLPSGTFPGVDDAAVYAFLAAHAPGRQ